MTKRLPWRCKNTKQAKDKARIYNSCEWKELRTAKLMSQPLCERCAEQKRYVSAHCVHHIVPIETAQTKEEMWQLAIHCGLSGLMSLCDQCHADIHNQLGYHTREAVKKRSRERVARWADRIMERYNNRQNDNRRTTDSATVDAKTED